MASKTSDAGSSGMGEIPISFSLAVPASSSTRRGFWSSTTKGIFSVSAVFSWMSPTGLISNCLRLLVRLSNSKRNKA